MKLTAMTMMLVGYARRRRGVIKDDEVSGIRMTKKILRCEGEGERKGAVRWDKTNRRKRVESVRNERKK